MALRDDIAKEMTTALRMRLTGDDEKRMTKSYTANPEAYQLYLQGRFWWNKRSEEGLNKGIEYFQQAIAKDPSYALAYSGLADCYSYLATYGFVSPKDTFPRAREAARKAVEIDETLAEGHSSLGYIQAEYDWDWSGARSQAERAVQLNPAYSFAHQVYAISLYQVGRSEEAIGEEKRALELDPLSIPISRGLGLVFYEARQYDQAIEQEQKTLELDPNFLSAHDTLGNAYVHKSMYKEGIAELEKALAISPGTR